MLLLAAWAIDSSSASGKVPRNVTLAGRDIGKLPEDRLATTVADLAEDPDLLAEIGQAVADANKAVSHAEAIKKFAILDSDFTVENGALTPTLKLKRNVIHDSYKQAIADLYT